MKKVCLVCLAVGSLLASCSRPVKPGKQAAGSLPFYQTPDFTPQWIAISAASPDTIHRIAAFRFIDQDGDSITEKTFAGKIYVADFFFTACPGICKRLTTNLALVQAAFKNDNQVLLLSHSVTPESDSVARLKQYAGDMGVISHKWHLVTGNHDEIYQIARRSYFADEDMGEKKGVNDFLHTENVLLIDTHRRIRGVYKGTSVKDMNDLIADIKTLEKED